jgi:hypothetical protein
MELAHWLQHSSFSPVEIADKSQAIYERALRDSTSMGQGNFDRVSTRDLKTLWEAYDERFFCGCLSQSLGEARLSFRLSRRLTSAAGQTVRRRLRRGSSAQTPEYEISISTTLLFQTFLDGDRRVTASGIECHDRLQAMQRVFEHELVHLAEMLVWTDSQCTATRFQSIAGRLFGHRQHTHQLITPRERAWTTLGLKLGDRVRFRVDGNWYEGRLNRITRRATVLVEDPGGARYSDGKRYAKFYVPLAMLVKAEH